MTHEYTLKEYGAGAFLWKNGDIIADFNSHRDAEEVMRLMEIGQKMDELDKLLEGLNGSVEGKPLDE